MPLSRTSLSVCRIKGTLTGPTVSYTALASRM
jgi:hypothetical protein